MKRLTLIRHAKSSWDDPGLDDADRPLAKRGRRDAPEMGKRLARRNIRPDALIASPALRAVTTARIMADPIGFPAENIVADPRLYDAALPDLLAVIQSLDNRLADVLLFGHNPGFTLLARHLTGEDLANLPTAGVFAVEFDVESWRSVEPGAGNLLYLDFPKNR